MAVKNSNILGKYLKKKRIESKHTQSDVSTRAGYKSSQFISNVERGVCAVPVDMLKVMIEMYKISENEMMKMLLAEQEAYFKKHLFKKR